MPWPLPENDDALLRLAKDYPYRPHGSSYLYRSDEVRPLPAGETDCLKGRSAVIAHGSNRAPDHLARKFASWAPEDSEIPVTKGWLHDYDVLYSAHVTRYGALATNLSEAPGNQVELYVTWLDARQLAWMHETELGSETYIYGALEGARFEMEGPARGFGAPSSLMVYLSRRGYLDVAGAPRALAALERKGGCHEVMGQEAALSHVRDRYYPGEDLDRHILATIRDVALRKALVERLTADGHPPRVPSFRATHRSGS